MIKHILFDLDCTLYSIDYGLERGVINRMKQYLARYFGTSVEEAMEKRRKKGKHYGTTLEWLIDTEGFTAIDDYFACIHPEDEADSLPPHPELRQFIENLPHPCSILTNSPGFHAERIINKMGLNGIFHHVFDMEINEYKGKPHASAFQRALDTLSLKPEEALFVDDMPSYALGFIALGGRAILLDERDVHKNYPHERIGCLTELTRFLD